MLLLIWKSFSSLWDHNLLCIKPGIIKVDGIDRMTYSEVEQEVSSSVVGEVLPLSLDMKLCFSQTGRAGLVVPESVIKPKAHPPVRKLSYNFC